jgi:hypothetical protein
MNNIMTIVVNKKQYQVPFPNVGQLMDIEGRKMALSNGTYGLLVAAKSIQSNKALDLIDALATFSVLVPELAKDLEVEVYTEMDILTGLLVSKAYTEQFFPWYDGLMKEINKTVEEASKDLKKVKGDG